MVFGPTDTANKQRHHLITYQFVDDCVMTNQDFGRSSIEPIQQSGICTRVKFFAQRGGSPHIGEKYGNIHFCAARRQALAAGHAYVRILP
jgi:hypothetical protein